MKNKIFKILLACVIVIIANVQGFAQMQTEPEMADVMRSNGKIYVVVGVLSIVLTGIFIYLFVLDRKLTTIEKRLK